MGTDRFDGKHFEGGRNSWDPPRNAVVWTPSDDTDLPFVSTAFQVMAAEDLKVTMANGTIVTIPGDCLAAGAQYSAQLKRIWDTDSGASHTSVLVWGPD